LRQYIRNLLAALRGRRAVSQVGRIIGSFETAAQQLDAARDALVAEQISIDVQARALLARSNEIVDTTSRARRLSDRLRDLTL
jgi:hypothetical protein